MAKRIIRKKSKGKKKRVIRKKILKNLEINPNLSLRTNVLNQSQPVNQSGNSVRSKILSNMMMNPIPLSFSQTPSSVNWDNVNKMRTDNDIRQNEINDKRKMEQDEIARKKRLDEEERKLKKETVEIKRRYEEEKSRADKAEKENEKQREIVRQEQKEKERLSKALMELQTINHEGELNSLKEQNATIQAQIEEAKMLTIRKKHELESNEQYRINSSLTKELNRINAENEALQKVLDSSDFKNANDILIQNQKKIEEERYRNKLLQEQKEMAFNNEKLRIENMKQLSNEEYKQLENESKDKILTLYQQQIEEQQKHQSGNRLKARYNRLMEQEEQAEKDLVDAQIETEKLARYQTAIGPNPTLSKTAKNTIKQTAIKKQQIDDKKEEIRRRKEAKDIEVETISANATIDYLNSEEHKKKAEEIAKLKADTKVAKIKKQQMDKYIEAQQDLNTNVAEMNMLNNEKYRRQINDINDVKTATMLTQKETENVKAITEAKKQSERAQAELYAQNAILNDTNNPSDKAAIAYQMQAKATQELDNETNEKLNLYNQINEMSSAYPKLWNIFLNQYPYYGNVVQSNSPGSVGVNVLENLLNKFTSFVEKNASNPQV